MPIRLDITKGLQQGRELYFEQAEVRVGRTSENDLVLLDHGVSRKHARILERGGQYFVEDMGSSNGTAHNGAQLAGEQLLRDGDRITVGPVEFTFVWIPPDGDEDATRPIRRNLPIQAPPLGDRLQEEAPPTARLQAISPVRPADSPSPEVAGASVPAVASATATPDKAE
ncbi:FHA domain-containing protein, partial [Pyxidicoccus sp. 3LG]